VLVVDNTGGDKDTEFAAKEFGARYVIESTLGLSRARNRGIAECAAEIVAFLDDDAEPQPDWLAFLLEPFKDLRVAAVTGETVPPGFDRGSYTPAPIRVLSDQVPQWFEIATFGGLGLGTNMALRRAACAGWKVFDERLGRGAPFRIAEESHAFASLLSRGHWAVHQPSAVVVHPSKPISIEQEAACSIAYWLLLFFEFPTHRMDLLRFLTRRLRQKPLTWPRNPQAPGEIITSGWRVRVKASLAGMRLYLRSRKLNNR
jgi:glycosyltransferase involved in cell wall biosynthesis